MRIKFPTPRFPLARILFIGLVITAFSFASSATPIRLGIGDAPGIDQLPLLAAVHRSKDKGVDIEVNFLNSEANVVKALYSGLIDIGVGTPYGEIQSGEKPVRMFYQLSRLRFSPVVNTRYYKTWADLNGADVYVHSKGSGTEAVMLFMSKKYHIKYANIHYLPGSGSRLRAMLQERIKASILDSKRVRLLLNDGQERFALLPIPEFNASDEALYADMEYIKKNQAGITLFLRELLQIWREINQNPDIVDALRRQYHLLTNMETIHEEAVKLFFREVATTHAYPDDGGSIEAIREDFTFYSLAGNLKGNPETLKVEDFWYFTPLNSALEQIKRP